MSDDASAAGPWSDLDRPPLRAEALRAALLQGPEPTWRALDVVASTGSTNADLAQRARSGEPEGLVLVADHQSAGRGRLARSWTAPPRASIATSVLLRPRPAEARWSWLPLLAGLAVVDALVQTCGLPARLKWPNDVLVPAGDEGEPRKIAGILAEVVAGPVGGGGSLGSAVVLGVGLNVTQSAAELPVPSATSLRLAGSATTDRDTVLRAYLRALAARYRDWSQAAGEPRASGLGAAYREACSTLGLRVEVAQGQAAGSDSDKVAAAAVIGVAEEVDDDGRLMVRDDVDTLHALAAGDVVQVRPERA